MKKLVPNDAVLIPDEATRVFQGEIFGVYQWQQQLYDGSFATFEMLERPDTTSVICIVDDQILVLDEEQPNSGKRRNFPGGRVDPEDSDVIAAAQREVLEETGYRFKNWRLVKVLQPIKKMEWFVHYVLAWDVEGQQGTAHEPGERITVEKLDFAAVKQLRDQRFGFLGEAAPLIVNRTKVSDLLDLPEFAGRTCDR